MPTWEYWHRIEYRLERAKGDMEHRYTEVCEDQGWALCPHRSQLETWFAAYTRICAEDYLERTRAPHGTWVVAVWRLGATPGGKGTLRGSIRMRWPSAH